ncbi:unnamed protein product [Spirodela intermedia]|uniref:Non-specific lipid-transfer protein n=1 Tax=Spirodela intermedia TaxID=51605 RepID=A0A7I8IAN7_SPIIN|nr:unnamed protein product [Spirodela intermedia]CAA6654628.1 unnamed protein product [Spirodela intermedia]
MARNISLMVVAAVLVCLLVAAPATAAVTCGQVAISVSGCLSYIRGQAPLTNTCCDGVRRLNIIAATTPDRQATCNCLKVFSGGMGNSLNPTLVSGLPARCGVRVPYPISTKTDCSKYVTF